MRRIAALLLSGCSRSEPVVLLPGPEGARALLFFLEETSTDRDQVRDALAADLESGEGLAEIEAVLRAPARSQLHMTALYSTAPIGDLELAPGPIPIATAPPNRPLPSFERGFRLRREASGWITPWRAYAALTGALADLRIAGTCTDADGDGYGIGCGVVDCDDGVASIHVGAPELCNEVDDDCDGAVDDGLEGDVCFAEEAGCHRPGRFACMGACAPQGPPICCDRGTFDPAIGGCCIAQPAPSCAFECTIDLALGATSCAGTVTASIAGGRAIAMIDLAGLSGLEIELQICDPTQWVFHLADSPTCNGGGADGGSSSNDAEIQLVGTDLTIFGNDYVSVDAKVLLAMGGFGPATGCSVRRVVLRDQRVQTIDPCADVRSPFALRLDPPFDAEGTPDRIWYLGLNRVFGSSARTGDGAISARICGL